VTRSALLRAAVAPLLATALGVTALGLLAPSAAAAPLPRGLPVLAAPADDDDATNPDRPVQIDVGRFEPRTLTPGTTVRVTGTLTNPGDAAITDLAIRLQRGELMTTRAELAADACDPDPATTVEPAFQQLRGELAPGGELDFDYTVPAADLQIGADGVYPVLLNVNGTIGGEQRRVGELSTYVIEQSVLPDVRAGVGGMW
jgi:ABC-type transport system substrate-binding protein